jgi:predicted lipid-binding transport protein (Tim44 family)
MKRTSFAIALLPALAIALAPGLAAARAGDGGSMGSRGSNTFSAPPATKTAPTGAAPMQRSMTQPSPSAPAAGAAYPGAAAPARSGFGSGLMGGMLGGLIGVGIGGMLMGHGFMGGGMGFLGFIGLIVQVLLVVVVVRWLFRMFMGSRTPAMAGGPDIYARQAAPGAPPPMGGGSAGGPPPIAIDPQDYQQFEQLLQGIQVAWSAQDLNGLRAMTTPEMLSYFNEQLSQQASRGVRNIVGDVKLQSGDLAQAWAERGVEYATVAMRFSMTDVTVDKAGRAVDGSASEHITATEIWTFMRAKGGHWVLSAIQQAR